MCGIAGIVGGAGARPCSTPCSRRSSTAVRTTAARPSSDGVGLGMTRLAIIDLVTGRQPMTSDDGAATIVFNGEIYNFRALRADLEAHGHRFRTQSDTEVILRAWQADGEACVDRLRGMFAFAIWDARRQRLFLARDRLGKKPLYYWQDGRTLVFASEIKALLCHPGPGRAVDWPALHHYLACGYDARRPLGLRRDRQARRPATPRRFDARRLHRAPLLDAAGGNAHDLRRAGRARARSGGAPRRDARGRTPAPGERRAARRVPVRRRRLERGRRQHARGDQRPDHDVLHRLRRRGGILRRAAVRAPGGRALRDRAPRGDPRAEGRRAGADHRACLRRAVRRLLRHRRPSPSRRPPRATSRSRCPASAATRAFAGYPRYLGLRVSECVGARCRAGCAVPTGALAAARCSVSPTRAATCATGSCASRPAPSSRCRIATSAGRASSARRRLADAGHAGAERALAGDPDVRGGRRAAWAAARSRRPVDGAFRIDLATYLPDDLLVMADRMSMAQLARAARAVLRPPPDRDEPGDRARR